MTNNEFPGLPNKNDNVGNRGNVAIDGELKNVFIRNRLKINHCPCKARKIFIWNHKHDGLMRL